MAPFLRNQWYTAATSTELGAKPLARTICNEPLVIFRGEDGTVAVLTDRCPHRKAPLSSGEVVGSDIQCGYHGIRFAANGACTHVPGNVPVGRDFRARCFSRARSPWPHLRLVRRGFACRSGADPRL